jgi:UDP-GlcNAc:undecaprenyl-phosphate GlcNAc-1-phosphate transferase
MGPWIAAPVSLLLLGLGVYCHRHWLAIFPEDPPGTGRHLHDAPTPMAGWVPVVVALGALGYAGVSWWVVAGIAVASLTGYLDDRGKSKGREMEMSWRRKGVLLLVATGLVLVETSVERETLPQIVLAFLWIFAVTNAVNFMDNTDGVASSLGALGLLFVSSGVGAVAWAAFAFLGFVPGNWPRPRVFLGDSGALGLGMCLGWVTLPSPDFDVLLPSLLPIAIFALDLTQVILARVVLGVPPWVGDRRHLTHISVNLGLPKVLVAPVFVALGCAIYFAPQIVALLR